MMQLVQAAFAVSTVLVFFRFLGSLSLLSGRTGEDIAILVAMVRTSGNVTAVVPTPKGFVYAMNSLVAPDDFYRLEGKRRTRLTSVNAARLKDIDWPTVTRFNFAGANNDTVWGYEGRPAWISTARTYPIVDAGSREMVQIIAERRERLRQEADEAE